MAVPLRNAATFLRQLTTGGRVRAGIAVVEERRADRKSASAVHQIGVIAIDNPSKKNALCGRMMGQFRGAVEALSAPAAGEVKCVVLCGAGGTWCAGAEMPTLAAPEAGAMFQRYMHDLTALIPTLPFMLLGVVEGHAMGGGAELVTAADVRVWAPGAELRFVQTRLGVCTGWGGTARLTDLCGAASARRLLVASPAVRADEALRLGIAQHVLSEEEVAGGDTKGLNGDSKTYDIKTFAELPLTALGSVSDAAAPPCELLRGGDALSAAARAAVTRVAPQYCGAAAPSVAATKRIVAATLAGGVAGGQAAEVAEFGALWGGPAQLRAVAAQKEAMARRRGAAASA